MDYKSAWEELKSSLLSRGEYFFFAKGDDPNSPYIPAERTVHFTLEAMKEMENKINSPTPPGNVIRIKDEK